MSFTEKKRKAITRLLGRAGRGTPGAAASRKNSGDFRQKQPGLSSHKGKGRKADSGRQVEPGRAERDRQLLIIFRLIAEGRLSGLSDLYDVLGRKLFGYIRTLVKSTIDAEDVLQEVFTKLAENRRKLVKVRNPRAYLFAMARNESLRLLKDHSRAKVTEPDHPMLETAAPGKKEPALSPREAQAALQRLPAEQREVIVLKIYEEFTFEEIGALTEVSPNTAASRYRYGLAKLAESLKRHRGA